MGHDAVKNYQRVDSTDFQSSPIVLKNAREDHILW